MDTTSYRHRRLVQEQQYTRHARRIALEIETDGHVERPSRMHHTEAVELILQYTDIRERAMRQALQIMATDLVTVYNFIDAALADRAPTGSRERTRQIVLEELESVMAEDLRTQYDKWEQKHFMDEFVIYGEPPF